MILMQQTLIWVLAMGGRKLVGGRGGGEGSADLELVMSRISRTRTASGWVAGLAVYKLSTSVRRNSQSVFTNIATCKSWSKA